MRNYFLFIIFIVLYFFDISNPDAIRQGTEGFYLLISDEMYLKSSFLTPIVHGEHHWSKPPLHFWLPMPIFHFFTDNFILAARSSISLLSLFLCFLISKWYQKNLQRNWYEAFTFLIIPVYFFKYSRIFMMEMPLTLFSTLTALYYFSYLKNERIKYLLLGIFFATSSVLIKGPVSLVFIVPGCFIYTVLKKKKVSLFFTFFIVSTAFSSIWFIMSYMKYGMEFFNYFFIRENLGKFQSKRYPITSVIQGLLIYSFPVWIFLIPILKKFKSNLPKRDETLFLFINFIFFYFIWFLPKQKSHHYAVPSIPLFVLIICYYFNELTKRSKADWLKIINNIYTFLIILLIPIFIIILKIGHSTNQTYISGSLFIFALWFHKNILRESLLRGLKPLLFLCLVWNFISPQLYLPLIPKEAETVFHKNKNKDIFVDFRKPFFVEQAAGRIIFTTNSDNGNYDKLKSGSLLFTSTDLAGKHLKIGHKVLSKWKTWKRGVNIKDAYNAIISDKLGNIQDDYQIVEID
jgi:4-amino-4-deoxy-L-arabinose transferase-like glycosyltransferase